MRKQYKNSNNKQQQKVALPIKGSYSVLVSAAICFVVAFVLYSNTFKHSYVLDDGGIIKDNWVVKKGLQGIPTILKTTYWYGSNLVLDTYRPVSKIMFAIEWQIAPNNPHLSHFINVLFYAISCSLLFIVLSKYLRKVHSLIPLLITLLYAAHPIHTEVVANIKSRDEIMSFFLLMLTLLILHKWFDRKKWSGLIVSLVMFFLSLLSKEGVITMIFLFPIIGWYFTESKPKAIIIASLMLIIPAIAYLFIRHLVLLRSGETFTVSIYQNFLIGISNPITHFATAVMLLGKYLLLLLIPYQLVCDYSFNQISVVGLSAPLFIVSILIFIAIAIYSLINLRKKTPLIFGLLFLLITISMYSNILFKISASFGERLMFLPSLGFCIALVFLFTRLLKVEIENNKLSPIKILRSKPIFTSVFIIIILSFSIKTVVRAAEWENEYQLYSNDIKRSPDSAPMSILWGNALFGKAAIEQDRAERDSLLLKAIAQYENTISILEDKKAVIYTNNTPKLNETKAVVFASSGSAYFNMGNYDKAKQYSMEALKLNTKCSEAYFNIGHIYYEEQKYEESIVEFKKCIQYAPENINAIKAIAVCYQNLKQQEEADQWIEKYNLLIHKLKK